MPKQFTKMPTAHEIAMAMLKIQQKTEERGANDANTKEALTGIEFANAKQRENVTKSLGSIGHHAEKGIQAVKDSPLTAAQVAAAAKEKINWAHAKTMGLDAKAMKYLLAGDNLL